VNSSSLTASLRKSLRRLSTTSSRRVVEAIKFSFREEQIVRLLLRGKTNKEIAAALQLSHKTVKLHDGPDAEAASTEQT